MYEDAQTDFARHEELIAGIRKGMARQDERIERIEGQVDHVVIRQEVNENSMARLSVVLDRVADTNLALSDSLSNMQMRCAASMGAMNVRFHEHERDSAGVDHDLRVEIEKDRKAWPKVAVALLLSAGATVGAVALYALPWLWHVIETAARAGSGKP